MDYAIQRGTVIDGTGAARFAADVLRRDGRVAEIAPHLPGEEDIQDILRAPWRALGTDGLLGGRPHPRAYGSCPRILGHYSRDLGLLTLEEAVRKMSSLPAGILHLSDRGVLQSGNAADVVVFNPQTIGERSSYEDPRQYPEGIPYVFVNGRPVLAGGRSTGERPGHLLQHHG